MEGYLGLNKLRDRDKVGPWLAQIARNRGKNWVRTQRRRGEAHARLTRESVEASPSTPLTEASRREMQEWVLARVHELPLKTRSAMLLFYVEGYSTGEAASALGVRESAVRKRLQFGREKIGAQLLEDVKVQDWVDDSKEQRSRIWAAMPLAGAAWLEGGGVSSAGVLGLGGLLSKWVVVPALVALLGLVALSVPGLLRDDPEVAEGPIGAVADSSSASGLGAIGGNGDPFGAVNADSNVDAEVLETDADAAETGTLSVRTLYSAIVLSDVNDGRYSFKSIDGPSIAGALVRLIPTEVSLSSEMESFLEDNGFTPREQDFASDWLGLRLGSYSDDKRSYCERMDGLIAQGKQPPSEARRISRSYDGAVEAETGVDGTYRFDGLATGIYSIKAFLPGVVSVQGAEERFYGIVQVSSSRPIEKLLRIRDKTSAIKGVVVDKETGDPVSGVTLALRSIDRVNGRSMTAQTLKSGEFSFSVQSTGYGAFELDVVSASHFAPTTRLTREIGKPVSTRIEVNRSAAVYGRVLNSDGSPAADVSIMRTSAEGVSASGVAYTDEEGNYRAPHDGGLVTLRANRMTSNSERLSVTLGREESLEHDFHLPPSVDVFFELRTDDGSIPQQIDRSQVTFELKRGISSFGGNSFRKMEDGRFVLRMLTPGDYEVLLYVKGYEAKRLQFSIDAAIQPLSFVVALKTATHSARVRAVDEFGAPVTSGHVSVKEEPDGRLGFFTSTRLYSVEADADGAYLLTGLWSDDFRVSFRGSGLSPKSVVASIPHSGDILIQVTRLAKSPLTFNLHPSEVSVFDATNPDRKLSVGESFHRIVTASGEIKRWRECAPGENEIYVIKSGYAAGKTTLTIGTDGKPVTDERVRIEIKPGGTLYGVVTDENGNTLSNRQILVFPESVDQYWLKSLMHNGDFGRALAQNVQSGDDGSFSLDYLPEGRYYVGIESLENWEPAGPFEVVAGMETGSVSLVVETK